MAAVGLERQARVLDRELDEPPLLAAERRAHDDAPSAALGQELLERARVGDASGTSTSGGALGAAP